MSRLDELIEKLCPDGAEFLTLQECTQKVKNIKWKSYSGNDKKYIDLSSVDRDLHCIMETQNINSDSAPSRAQQIVQADDILLGTTRPMLKRYCMIPETYDNEICSTGFCVLRANTEIVLPKWIYHNIATTDFFVYVEQNQKGASYPAISDASVKAFSLPVPPLEVQREIVRILESFTLLTDELTTKLADELTARKKQYEFYRNKLLHFESDAQIKTIGDLCTVVTGGEPPTDCIKGEISDSTHPYPVWGNGKEVYGYSETYKIDRDAVVISSIGANTGAVYYREAFFTPIIRLKVVMPKDDKLNTRFLFHALSTTEIKSKSSSVPNMNANEIKAIKIPVPSIAVQNKIVSVLDNFDAICTDLNIGLPAEIEARQKQYEYYRDLLLTFAETDRQS